MAEMSKAYVPEFMGDPNPRKKILKLARKITDCVDHKIKGVTVNDPEYWGLACIMTDEMADVALSMKVRHHYTIEELEAMNPNFEKEKLHDIVKQMSDIGILEYDYGNHYDDNGPIPGAKKVRRYTLPMFVPGSAEFTNMIKRQLDEHPELAMFFERMTYLPLTMVTPMVPAGGAGIGMHVIPVEKAIEMENGTIDIEHLSYWLKNTKVTLALAFAPAAMAEPNSVKAAATLVKIGVSALAIWLTTAARPEKVTTSPTTKQCKFFATQKQTASFTKSPTLTAKTRFLQSATAT